MLTDVCGDDRFSPAGVTEGATVTRQAGLNSHGEVLCECLSVREYSDVINGRDWKMCPWAGRPEIGWWFGHLLPFWFGRGGRFGRKLPVWRDFPARAPRMWRNCAVAQLHCCAEGSPAQLRGCAEDWSYISPVAEGESPFGVRPVTESHLFRPARGRALGLWLPRLPFRHLSGTSRGDIRLWWDTMSSDTNLLIADQAGAAVATSEVLPGTFIGLGLDLMSAKLYDLGGAILDVMGLRAIQPRVAVVKVMSVPDSRCVRVVVPDDHVSNGFHEILIHDLEDEEPPFVAVSELGCLRLDWPRALFMVMARYQSNLDQMRKECRERFRSTQSGVCTTCGKPIQQNLDRHVALCHMDAQ